MFYVPYSNELHLEIFLIRLVVIYYVVRSILLFLYVSYIVTSEWLLTLLVSQNWPRKKDGVGAAAHQSERNLLTTHHM